MKIVVEDPGLQTTIQARPRTGSRHLGVPASGPADPLSMALANRLVGNLPLAPALETTLTGVTLGFDATGSVAVCGATAKCSLNGQGIEQHETIPVQSGDVLQVGGAEEGVRSYVAVAGRIAADDVLASRSTYLTAGFGGHQGRALKQGDVVEVESPQQLPSVLSTPDEFRLPMPSAWSLRATASAETERVDGYQRLFTSRLTVGRRCDRMGINLEGDTFSTDVGGQMPSVPVFPGIIQCPPDGGLYLLSVDSGTTGGYPRVAKIARLDLHILGQLRPGNGLRLIERSPSDAAKELSAKHEYWGAWIAGISDVI